MLTVHVNRECGPVGPDPNKQFKVRRLARHMFLWTKYEQAQTHIPSESVARDLDYQEHQ
jgi:hypothetical protein